ncbi:hypothetical protein CS0771_04630 [Catellatospora sp. IY07-71]|nr:hypothetical protein CS0771_04630 [Catellatospora sp. IY07-71]
MHGSFRHASLPKEARNEWGGPALRWSTPAGQDACGQGNGSTLLSAALAPPPVDNPSSHPPMIAVSCQNLRPSRTFGHETVILAGAAALRAAVGVGVGWVG